MKDSIDLRALDISRRGEWLWLLVGASMARIYKWINFLSWIGIEDIGRRDVGVDPGGVPIGRPCPEWTPRGPADSPASPTPTESETPTAAAPTPSPAPVPAGPAPAPSAMPASVPSTPVVAVPGEIVGDHTSMVEGRGCGRASHLGAWCGEGVPLSVGYRRMVYRGARPCWHGRSAGAGRSIALSFATHSPGIAGCELMPSRRSVAAAVTFPRPRTGTCTAGAAGTNARPRGRSPTAEPGRAAVIAATVAATAVGSAKGATASVETATSASVGATPSPASAVTTAMLCKGGRREANEAERYDS
jgi:hypothetical protein